MSLEIERKYLDVDLQSLTAKLISLGAQSHGRHFESNAIFDTPDLSLFKLNKLLRLRLREWRDKSDCILTLKLPYEQTSPQNLKIREELETKLLNFHTGEQILKNIGFKKVAIYEKVRESWKVALAEIKVEVDLDILPFGQIVEIEGEIAHINKAASLLGLDKYQISTNSYHELNQEWQKANGLPKKPGFWFDEQQKHKLRHELGLFS